MAISPQQQSHNRTVVEQHQLRFPILSDPRNRVAATFGLCYRLPEDLQAVYRALEIDLPAYNGDSSWTLAMPARFVVTQDGRIRAAAADPNGSIRQDPAETVRTVHSL